MIDYELKTSFWTDFSIAEKFGLEAVMDTYERAFKEWKTNTVYVTELTMVLNWKLFQWYKKDKDMYYLYTNLYYETDDWCCRNLKGADLAYYYKTTD